jgi:Uncharacterised nucleotidyltransferase
MTTPECWLLALADPENLRADLPRQRLDAEEVVSLCVLAELHGVLPATLNHVDHLLRDKPQDFLMKPGLNSEVFATIDLMRKRVAERLAMALFLGAESRKLSAGLVAAGAEGIVLKGADFAARLYTPPSLRPFIDVDLLVRASDWDRVNAVMSRMGYVPRETPLKHAGGYSERTWEHPAMPGAMVEVHDNLVNSPTIRRGVSVHFEDLPLERGTDGHLRATPAGLLIMAAVHGAASHSFDKLQHLCDIAQIVRGRAGPIDETSVRACLAKTGAGFSLALGLDLTARALNETAAADLLARLKPRWPRLTARLLITPALVARSQGRRRRGVSWRRQMLRQMLKSRHSVSRIDKSP